jgi:hypothetical protein
VKQIENIEGLLSDLRELTATNCHGEALEKIACAIGDRQLEKAFEAVNTLHAVIGYLHPSLADLRKGLTRVLMAKIERDYGESVKERVYSFL